MANDQNIDRVINHLRKLPDVPDVDFNMMFFAKPNRECETSAEKQGTTCGAVACIAGHTLVTFGLWSGENWTSNVPGIARELLGLAPGMSAALFEPDVGAIPSTWYPQVKISDAIHALKIAKTGNVTMLNRFWRRVHHRIVEEAA